MIYLLLLLILITILLVFVILPRLNSSHEKIIKYATIPVIIFLAYYLYRTIKLPIEEMKLIEKTETEIKEHLLYIKAAQIAYKSTNGKYCGNWDSLITFCKTGKLALITAIGSEDDTSANRVFVRDTQYVAVRDSIFPKEIDIDKLRYNPGTTTEFEIFAGEIKRNLTKVFVFEVKDKNPINPARRKNNNEKALCIGSRTEVKSTGNWE